MKKSITFETATLMMDMALFTIVQIRKANGESTEAIVNSLEEMGEDVRACFRGFCELNGIEEVEVEK